MEFIIELFILYLLKYPGILVRYIFFKCSGKEKTLKELKNDDSDLNIQQGLIMITLITSVIITLS